MLTASSRLKQLGDFTATPRVLFIGAMAIVIGIIASYVAWVLLKLIGLFTNLFYYGRISFQFSTPTTAHLGVWSVLIPVVGALIIGVLARYGSEKIRGHGIPEAIESILMNGSRVSPRLAILKPISAAISIGSGGPFGAEGPIIMTGGAFGSLIAQFFHLTSAERKTLLVAGAAAGMSATFAAPVSAVLLAVELLLFEWKPRSVIPVALASAAAGAARQYILGMGPLFAAPPHPTMVGPAGLSGCLIAGIIAGFVSVILTQGVYAAEDAFYKLPIHWMWWPAIGAVFVGIGGLIFPPALGVGYANIGVLLQGHVAMQFILGVLLVKSAIWVISLGSGTSGGVLAPVLMIGAAMGGGEALFLPHFGEGFWPLISMGAVLAGTMGSPFTGVLFALELTHDYNMLLPLLLACFFSFTVTTLTLKRSILTEKIARRGYHLSRECAIDPLEMLFVREVMRTNVVAFPPTATVAEARQLIVPGRPPRGQHVFPVIEEDRRVLGVISRDELAHCTSESLRLGDLVSGEPTVAFADEPLRAVVNRMVDTGLTRMPVTEAQHPDRLAGMVSLEDLLRARGRSLAEERQRERVLRLRLPLFGGRQTERVVMEPEREATDVR